jgi:hypothetical protein
MRSQNSPIIKTRFDENGLLRQSWGGSDIAKGKISLKSHSDVVFQVRLPNMNPDHIDNQLKDRESEEISRGSGGNMKQKYFQPIIIQNKNHRTNSQSSNSVGDYIMKS